MIVKNYQELYNQYWWKYKTLEDYVTGLEKRLDSYEEGVYMHTFTELELLRIALKEAKENNGRQLY